MLGGAGASKTLRGQTGFGVPWWMPPLSSMMLAWFLWTLHVRSVMERRAIMQSCPPGPPGARPSRMLPRGMSSSSGRGAHPPISCRPEAEEGMAFHGRTEVVTCLPGAGVDRYVADLTGYTARSLALMGGQTDVCLLLRD